MGCVVGEEWGWQMHDTPPGLRRAGCTVDRISNSAEFEVCPPAHRRMRHKHFALTVRPQAYRYRRPVIVEAAAVEAAAFARDAWSR